MSKEEIELLEEYAADLASMGETMDDMALANQNQSLFALVDILSGSLTILKAELANLKKETS